MYSTLLNYTMKKVGYKTCALLCSSFGSCEISSYLSTLYSGGEKKVNKIFGEILPIARIVVRTGKLLTG